MKIVNLLILVVFLTILSCYKNEETNSQNLVKYLESDKLMLYHTKFKELPEQHEIKIEFIKSDNYVNVEVYGFGKRNLPSRKMKILLKDYEEIENVIKCLVDNHFQENSPEKLNLAKDEYKLELNYKRMKLIESDQNCGLRNLLMNKLNHIHILDVENKIG